MAVGARVSVGEYLSTVYEADCEFVDGELIERNTGESDHSGIQMALAALLFSDTASSIFIISTFPCVAAVLRAVPPRVPARMRLVPAALPIKEFRSV